MYRLLFGIMQGLKYRFLRIYRDFDFTDISEISEKYWRNIVDIFSQISIESKLFKINRNT